MLGQNHYITALLAATVFFSQISFANDTTATVGAGGIQYKKSDKISMDEEVLKISIDEIDITYHFFNHSDKVIMETVAFPLPPALPHTSARWDEEAIARNILRGKDYDSNVKFQYEGAPFINFQRSVNGSSYYHHGFKIEAIDNAGKNITALLKKNDIPLSAVFLSGYLGNGELEQNPKLKEKIKRLNLLKNEDTPNWKTQITYFWNQSFPPQETIVTGHRYRPATGHHWLEMDSSKNRQQIVVQGENSKWLEYCPTPADEKAVMQTFKQTLSKEKGQKILRVYEVEYILSTGANWHGPIKKFRLEVKPPSPNTLVLFCWDGKIEKKRDGTLVTTRENFTPKKDLKILFIPLDINHISFNFEKKAV